MEEKNQLDVLNEKKEARKIAKTILEFGVTEDQKIEIMINLALTLEDNNKMKSIFDFLKKFTTNFNLEENSNKISSDNQKNKILLD